MSLPKTPPRTRSRARMASPPAHQPIFEEEERDIMEDSSPSKIDIVSERENRSKSDSTKLDLLLGMMHDMNNRIQKMEKERDARELRESANKINVDTNEIVPYQVRLPRGGWLKNPFEELKFIGKNDLQNPVRFVKKFEKLAEYERVPRDEQIYYFEQCMKGDAALWIELQDINNIDLIKNKFLENYWGIHAQMNFRNKLYFGKYKWGTGTMAEYALKMAREAKTLTPPMGDYEIIHVLKEHFDSEIVRELRPSVIRNISEMVEMIETIENERATRKLRYETKGVQGNQENWRENQNTRSHSNQGSKWGGGNQNAPVKDQQEGWKKINYTNNSARSVDIVEIPENKDARPIRTSYVRESNYRRNKPEVDNKQGEDKTGNLAVIDALKKEDELISVTEDSESSESGEEKEINSIAIAVMKENSIPERVKENKSDIMNTPSKIDTRVKLKTDKIIKIKRRTEYLKKLPDEWIKIIQKSQEFDEELKIAYFTNDNIQIIQNLVRIKTPRGQKIALPEACIKEIFELIHEEMHHLNIDKMKVFIEKWFCGFDFDKNMNKVIDKCTECREKKNKKLALSVKILGPFDKVIKKLKYVLSVIDSEKGKMKLFPLENNNLHDVTQILKKFLSKNRNDHILITAKKQIFENKVWQEWLKNSKFKGTTLSGEETELHFQVLKIIKQFELTCMRLNKLNSIEEFINYNVKHKVKMKNNFPDKTKVPID